MAHSSSPFRYQNRIHHRYWLSLNSVYLNGEKTQAIENILNV